MSKPPSTESGRWLLLIASLPTEDPAARMRMLRTLESLGSAVIREGAYLLPDNASCRQGLEHLSEYIVKGAGSAQVLQVTPVSEAQQRMFRSLFDRSARYEELIKVVDSLKVGFGIADPSAISRVLNKQHREFEAISALDFFPNEQQTRATLSRSPSSIVMTSAVTSSGRSGRSFARDVKSATRMRFNTRPTLSASVGLTPARHS
jgi:hypothetical protein